jgi:SAM-dependent methyltransferase
MANPCDVTGEVPARAKIIGVRRFVEPDVHHWATGWARKEAADDRDSYLNDCWMFDPFLGPLLPEEPGLTALEIGCYPGGYMTYLHRRFGYTVSGLDYVPQAATLAATLRSEGVRVGQVLQGDFWDLEPQPQYDVVSSFGFIEHFDDPEAAITRHAGWLRPGGRLVLEVPSFHGAQLVLRRWLDRPNLELHNLDAMEPDTWRKVFRRLGFDQVHLGYFRTFEFWVDPDPSRSHLARVAAGAAVRAGAVVRRLEARLGREIPSRWTSPYLIAVAWRSA